jgi:hypothetical protein
MTARTLETCIHTPLVRSDRAAIQHWTRICPGDTLRLPGGATGRCTSVLPCEVTRDGLVVEGVLWHPEAALMLLGWTSWGAGLAVWEDTPDLSLVVWEVEE